MSDRPQQPRASANANAMVLNWFRMKHITAAERLGRWMIVVGLAFVLIPMLLGATGLSRPLVSKFGPALSALPVLVGIGLLIGSWFALRAGVARRWREAQANGFQVCLGCGYHLGRFAPIGTCPECARAYNSAELPREWVTRWGHAPRDGGRGMFRPGPPWVLTSGGEVKVPEEAKPAPGERIGALIGTIGWVWLGLWGARAALRYSRMTPVGMSLGQWVAVGGVGLALFGAGIACMTITRSRIRRRLAETEGRLCVGCRGSLVGLGEVGKCRACGRAFDAAELEWAWWRYGATGVHPLIVSAERRRS